MPSGPWGLSEAQYDLGRVYENGIGVRKNKKTALSWYRKAADRGDEQAAEALKRLKAD